MDNSDNIVFLGTELKLSINIGGTEKDSPIPDMGEFSFDVEVFCNPKKSIKASYISENKSVNSDSGINIIYSYKQLTDDVDPDSFILLLDTNFIGTGSVKCKVTAYLPDQDFENTDDNNTGDIKDSFRTEVSIVDTGIIIEKSI